MEEGIKFFVGLDVHKDTLAMAVAEAGGERARWAVTVVHDIGKLLKRLASYGEPARVQVVYEAGPTGYGLQREQRAGPRKLDRAISDRTAPV